MKQSYIFFCSLWALLWCTTLVPLKIDRVILSTNEKPEYIQFWPIVAQAWKEIVGVQPTLALIGDETITVDETLGDVIRFEPIQDYPTSLYAQLIRLLIPVYFQDEVCLLADIDMIPLTKSYFVDSIQNVPEDNFVIFRDKSYTDRQPWTAICYNAAKGKVFKEIFNLQDPLDIPKRIKQWMQLTEQESIIRRVNPPRKGRTWDWHLDERILYYHIHAWNKYDTHCTKLGHKPERRINRAYGFNYEVEKIKLDYYIDAHCNRPYSKFKQEIHDLIKIYEALHNIKLIPEQHGIISDQLLTSIE